MKIKQFTTAFFLLFCLVTVSFGQGRHKGQGSIEDRIDHRLDKMDEVVKFTGTQRNDVKALFTDIAKKKKDAFCTNEIGSDGMKKAMKSIRKEKEDKLEKILNKDQMKLWKDYKKQQKADHSDKKGKRGKGKGTVEDRINDHLDKMNEVVKFTGTQRDQMKTLLTDINKRKKDAVCTHELGSDNMKSAMKAIREAKHEGMKKILNEDQQKLWKDHMKSKRGERKKEGGKQGFDDDKKEK